MSDEYEWVVVERIFNGSIEAVWGMWTEPDLFKKWYGPIGMTVPVAEMDVVVGGKRKVCMSMERPDRTMTMWFTGEYKEVTAPTRLVYTESMCDEAGSILSPQSMGMPADHPEVTEIIVELSEDSGKTHMKMIHVGIPAGSGGAGGWGQAFDKLAALFGGG